MATPANKEEHVPSKEFDNYRVQAFDHADSSHEQVAGFYNKWAETYNQLCGRGGYCATSNFAAIAADVISDKSSKILDAASGTGMVGQELKVLGFNCIDAFDPSQESLNKSKETQSYTEYICDTLDEHRTNISDNHYDAVLICGAFGVPGHVSEVCFPELLRITKPGGFIMFTVCESVLEQCEERMQMAIQAFCQKGQLEVVDNRWMPYLVNDNVNEKAKVPILRVLKP